MTKFFESKSEIQEGKTRGLLILFRDGEYVICEEDFPRETYIVYQVWGLDLLRKIYEHSKFRRWLLEKSLGRYAFRELMGLRDELVKTDHDINFGYGLENCEYHKHKKDW